MKERHKIIFSIILTLLLIIVVGIFRLPPISSELKSNYFWLNKFENNQKYDVVIYGDSRTYRGVNPEIVVKNQNLSAFNYGFTSAGYSTEIFALIDSSIDMSKKPILILGITPYSLTVEASKNLFYHQEKNRKPFDKFKRLNIDNKLSFFDRIVMEEYFKPNEENVQQEYYDAGWVASTKNKIDTIAGLNSYKTIFENNQVSDSIITLLMDNISKWTQKGISVYAFRPPTIISMEALENEKSGFNMKEFVNKINKAGGTWLNIKNGDYISYDGSHLQKKSAIKLSKTIRKLIFE